MKERTKFDNRETELRLFLGIGRQLLNTDDLHFGYWGNGLEVTLRNLPQAQENHSNFIISHIPEETRTILDVGCGVGRLASRLMENGYEVHGVSPSTFLAAEARRIVGDDFLVFESRIEELKTDNRYDLILFSESFQYVKMDKALTNCLKLLNESGHILICDFFRTNAKGDSPLKAGHYLSRFNEIVSEFPLVLIEDIDITEETAPTMDLADGIMQTVVRPVWEHLLERMKSKRPRLLRLLKWKFKKKIERMEWRYLSSNSDGQNFKKFKTYRLRLYKYASAV